MLLTLHDYKEKKNTLTFVRYELMTFFSTMSSFHCKKGEQQHLNSKFKG